MAGLHEGPEYGCYKEDVFYQLKCNVSPLLITSQHYFVHTTSLYSHGSVQYACKQLPHPDHVPVHLLWGSQGYCVYLDEACP